VIHCENGGTGTDPAILLASFFGNYLQIIVAASEKRRKAIEMNAQIMKALE